jgi:hypothetical protein
MSAQFNAHEWFRGIWCLSLWVAMTVHAETPYQPQVGDIVFHTSMSAQSLAVQ